MKSSLRRLVPPTIWESGARVKGRMADGLVAGGVAAARLLSVRRALALREGTARAARLDYDRATIMLSLDARSELYRLRACEKEPETRAWLEKEFRAGDVLYDVGANVGAYSLVAHAVAGGACTVYAFEPGFNTFAALSRNILLNGCQNEIIPFPIALSDRPSLAQLRYSSLAPGASMHEWIESQGAPATGDVMTTLTMPLDTIVAMLALRPPTHIKLDVDGPEVEVLRGAEDTLRASSLRALLVEVDGRSPRHEELCGRLERAGFQLSARHPRKTENVWNCEFTRP